ncbi:MULTISPECIES: urease accessory protein UreD [unclassified Massilia]|uniref:urease accessory protein UreD n=1 Tax=unclassified Massilia TaxID=2609279 RepID=UPI00177EC67E|nr:MULTISPECIES: urease accessory protein UreD [unclassified Massilia]MBD8531455.1 urease accessory protein UreD [Massilia sp. CFBP 13647]MBD8673749.1 urease accessory protein UreD [Massilia sp. CFBP 13721]
MRDEATATTHSPAGWLARLELDVVFEGGASIVGRNRHQGPLRVQKPLYPEGAQTVHAIVVHPPGGIRAGDRLEIAVSVGPGAHAFLTSPGATKWYRSDDEDNGDGAACQSVQLAAGDGAALEWMPQETIYFNGARAVQRHTVHLGAAARYIGCEVMCFARQASGERFERGRLRLHSEIWCAGQLLWYEQACIDAGSEALDGPFGLDGASVCATLTAVGPPLSAALQAQVRALDPALGASQLKSVFIARLLCGDSEHARAVMTRAWQLLRPHLLGRPAILPRIWAT